MSAGSDSHVTSLLEGDRPQFVRQRAGGIFRVVRGVDKGESCALRSSAVTIGTSSSCDLILTDKAVSRRHLEATIQGGEVLLRDLGSLNGSFVQGAKFKEIVLQHGVEITLGQTVLLFVPDEEVVEPQASAFESFGHLLGRDVRMRRLFNLLADASPTDATILIEGETGTGKELVAAEIHGHSARRNGPFVVFDCAAVPRELIESALFGHVKGSFTGATADRKGAFAEAHGGTIFLDEIGELALELQPALLRVLDRRAVRRVGANEYQELDVRVIAATNRKLEDEVAARRFRADLYYRLAVLRVTLPALRERGADVPLLVDHFVQKFAVRRNLRVRPEDMELLQRHSWPGNVRELRNVIERACVLAQGSTIDVEQALTQSLAQADLSVRTDLPFKEAKGQLVERFEREYIEGLMKKHSGNLSAAAREAQIDRKHLRDLLRKYGLTLRSGSGDD